MNISPENGKPPLIQPNFKPNYRPESSYPDNNRISLYSIATTESDFGEAIQNNIPKRRKIMNEIVETENRYVQDLLFLEKVF
jgi:hypothetical protein